MSEENNKTPEVIATENNSFQPEIAEVKSGLGYQPEIVETVSRSAYQPEAVEANQNEYVRRAPEGSPAGEIPKPVNMEWARTEGPKAVETVQPLQQVARVEETLQGASKAEEPVQQVTRDEEPVQPEVTPPPFAAVQNNTVAQQPQQASQMQQPGQASQAQMYRQPQQAGQPQPVPAVRPVPPAQQKKKEKKEKKGPNFFVKALMAIAFGILFGIFGGVSFFAVKTIGEKLLPGGNGGTGAIIGTVTPPTSEPASEIETSEVGPVVAEVPATQSNIVDVAKECMPSIVIINVTVEQNYYGMVQDVPGSGSGIIVGQNDEEYFIATNYHVIADAKTVDVQFCDGSTAPAVVKGKKVNMDLAVITVDISSLGSSTQSQIKIASIGDSDNLEVGETAIAIGNALGYGQSVTVGVISALDREITTSNGEVNRFIQTDAAINPGNSGGALINMKGEVIGINSNKLGGSAVEGMGYAIPITTAQPIIEKLIAKQELVALPEDQQSYFGITGSEVKSGLTTTEGVSIPAGIYVNQVQPGTAAEEAGIQKNDIITEFEGDSVTTMNDLLQYLAAYPAGSKVRITFRRYENYKFEEHEVEVTLMNKSAKPQNP